MIFPPILNSYSPMKGSIFVNFLNNRSKGLTMQIYFHSLWSYLPRVPTILTTWVNEFVSSSEQTWRNLALVHHLLTNGYSAVNGCRQNECPNIWFVSYKHATVPLHKTLIYVFMSSLNSYSDGTHSSQGICWWITPNESSHFVVAFATKKNYDDNTMLHVQTMW